MIWFPSQGNHYNAIFLYGTRTAICQFSHGIRAQNSIKPAPAQSDQQPETTIYKHKSREWRMIAMNTLLHTCCAPCAVYCVDSLRQEGINPHPYWFNPNIHPYTEYRSRKTTLEEYAKSIQLPLIIDNTYGLRSFVRAVIDDLEHRCFLLLSSAVRANRPLRRRTSF